MAEYIEREAFIGKLEFELARWKDSAREYKEDNSGVVAMGEAIHELTVFPAADVVEVRHGEWVDKFNRNRMATQSFCSVCGEHSGIGGIESNRHKPYCPNCGAKMDGKGEGE